MITRTEQAPASSGRTGSGGLIGTLASTVLAALAVGSWWLMFIALLSIGVFYNGVAMTALSGLGVVLSPKESPGALPGMNGACFGLGASLGLSVASVLVASSTADNATSATGFTLALATSAALTLAALLTATFIARPS